MALAASSGALAACGGLDERAGAVGSRDEASPTPESGGYTAPPTLTAAVRETAGILLEGRATPNARVRLAAPDGTSIESTAGRDGTWRARLPGSESPRMYALSMQVGARTVRAEGALMTLPAPGPPAILARAGYAAQPTPSRAPRPTIVAVDFDAAGSAAVGGVAPSNTRVQLSVDGQPADVDLTDGGGRFALVGPRTRPLSRGEHQFAVSAPQGTEEASVDLSPPSPLTGAPMRATRTPSGWRVDWATPGGGVQSTLVLDRAGRAGA